MESEQSHPRSNEPVLEFIRAAKTQNMTDEFTFRLLRHNGWSERAILSAYSSYYGDVLKQPIPMRGAGIESARHAFFYLLAFITLSTWAFALGNLFYVFVDRMLRDPLTSTGMEQSWRMNIAFDMAALIVAFPVFLWMTWIVQHEATMRPEVLESGVRKWLTYIALVVTASCLIGDAVVFLQQFLNGSLSQSFGLKSLVLVAIAGGIFLYYLGAVRAVAATVTRDRAFAGIAAAVVLIGIGIGFTQNGAPAAQRSNAFDARRIENLQAISRSVRDSWIANGRRSLPARLDTLLENVTLLADPQTQRPYRYRVLAGSRYELCAIFETNDLADSDSGAWRHPAGYFCFIRDASRIPQ